ncbi:MAG: AAA family ATPase [Myxococcales bacterium]|nr:MAG: AAA family ATPase [Myxococcales bacterium]
MPVDDLLREPHRVRPDLLPQISATQELRGSRGKIYRPTAGLLAAVNVALDLQRPLLLTGEPGCGKTDFAFACAGALGAVLRQSAGDSMLLSCSVRSDTRARDFLYTHDAVRRFGDAQFGGDEGRQRAQDPRHYVDLQPLGIALASPRRRVVLIDEIDKAPRDLPNDLLRELDKTVFTILEIPGRVPEGQVTSHGIPLRKEMIRPDGSPAPLIIITSNVENQLPDAFLRRCIFWDIKFPEDELPDILEDHFPTQGAYDARFRAASISIFRELRKVNALAKRPATAELLDWVAAIGRVLHPDAADTVRAFAAQIDNGVRPLPWSKLPALSCLIKLRDDLSTLSRL